jgi:hypothetical protein
MGEVFVVSIKGVSGRSNELSGIHQTLVSLSASSESKKKKQ